MRASKGSVVVRQTNANLGTGLGFLFLLRFFEVLALVMRSPSGFNAQPYECVVVTSEEAKKKLSKAMLGANRER